MSTNSSGTVEVVFSSPTAAEVLKHFERFEPQFQEFFAACERPESNFNRDYKDLSKQEFPNFVGFRPMAQSLSLRASAELALGKSEEALRDIKACIRLADALKNEPIIVAGMIRVAIDGLIITPIWEGLAAHRWNDQQLQELQSALEKIELIPTTIRCLQANRAYENFLTSSISQRELLKKLSRSKLSEKADNSRDDSVFTDIVRMIGFRMIPWLPRGWIYANLALENRRFYRDFIEPIDAQRSVIPFGQLKANHEKTLEEFKKIRPGNFITSVSFPDFSKAIRVIARNQTEINEAIIACGLERYRLQHGKFPEKLESIASKFLQTIPHDIVNGKPLVYRLTDDGQYLLYSLAWDLKDNNAKPASWDWRSEQEGDWVWRFPTKRKSLN